ncbi:MAG: hypothetical protein ACTSU5_18930 [Promethearchaeota archaeon]
MKIMFLDLNEWQVKATEEALERADGPGASFVDHGDVKAWVEGWGTGGEREGSG